MNASAPAGLFARAAAGTFGSIGGAVVLGLRVVLDGGGLELAVVELPPPVDDPTGVDGPVVPPPPPLHAPSRRATAARPAAYGRSV